MPWAKPVGWLDDQSWKEVSFGAAASYVDPVPQPSWATHLVYELLVRGDAVATTVSLLIGWGASSAALDTTTTNYHNQRVGASNGAASVPEAQTLDVATVAAGQAVTDYYSTVYVWFPFYKNARQKQALIMFSAERAALDQIVALANHKRQGGSVVGAQTDVVGATRWSMSSGNLIAQSFRRRLVA